MYLIIFSLHVRNPDLSKSAVTVNKSWIARNALHNGLGARRVLLREVRVRSSDAHTFYIPNFPPSIAALFKILDAQGYEQVLLERATLPYWLEVQAAGQTESTIPRTAMLPAPCAPSGRPYYKAAPLALASGSCPERTPLLSVTGRRSRPSKLNIRTSHQCTLSVNITCASKKLCVVAGLYTFRDLHSLQMGYWCLQRPTPCVCRAGQTGRATLAQLHRSLR